MYATNHSLSRTLWSRFVLETNNFKEKCIFLIVWILLKSNLLHTFLMFFLFRSINEFILEKSLMNAPYVIKHSAFEITFWNIYGKYHSLKLKLFKFNFIIWSFFSILSNRVHTGEKVSNEKSCCAAYITYFCSDYSFYNFAAVRMWHLWEKVYTA